MRQAARVCVAGRREYCAGERGAVVKLPSALQQSTPPVKAPPGVIAFTRERDVRELSREYRNPPSTHQRGSVENDGLTALVPPCVIRRMFRFTLV